MVKFFKRLFGCFFNTKPEDVLKNIECFTGFTLNQLKGTRRGKEIAEARRRLIKELDLYTTMSNKEIAKYVNRSVQYIYYVLSK